MWQVFPDRMTNLLRLFHNEMIAFSVKCDPTPGNEALCGKLILSYDQKCKGQNFSKIKESMLKNKLWQKFYEFVNWN